MARSDRNKQLGERLIGQLCALSGSRLNMTESMQRMLKRGALEGQHPTTPEQIIDWLEATARGWNRDPTAFEWGGKRAARRVRSREQRHVVGGAGRRRDDQSAGAGT